MKAEGLQCKYLKNPYGIDVHPPFLLGTAPPNKMVMSIQHV